jgi:hypothetical protein
MRNITGIVSLCLFIGTFIYLSFVSADNSNIREDLKEKTLESELRLSEKLEKEKENEQLLAELESTRQQLREAAGKLLERSAMLSVEERKLKNLQASQNHGQQLKNLQAQLAWLTAKRSSDSTQYVNDLFALESSNQDFGQLVDDRLYEKTRYIEQIDNLVRARINNVLIEPLTKSEKLTLKASRVKTLKVTAQVSDRLPEVTFAIVDPNRKSIHISQRNSAISEVKSAILPHAFYIVPDLMLGITEPKKEIQLIYIPEKRLDPGTYQIDLLSKKDTIANIRIKLR